VTPQTDRDEEKVRQHYREIRDRLKGVSATLAMASNVERRPDISAILSYSQAIYEWLMGLFDEVEKLRLEMNRTNNRHEEIMDVLLKIQAWQKEYQPSLDKLKEEQDNYGKLSPRRP
jgi:uncharacterized coiled-coil DUF342 family protein